MMAALVALLLGFVSNAASTQTTTLEARFGRRLGRGFTVLLRDVLGIPLWAFGLGGAIARPALPLFRPGKAGGRV